jgi:RNA polymerase sigma-70 factor (ECF subfamily)
MTPTEFDEVFTTYEKPIGAYVRQMVQNETIAEDLTQEVFLKVHRGLPGFKGDSKLSTWIYRIATNVCLDYFRSAAHKSGKATASLDDEVPPESSVLTDDSQPVDQGLIKEEMSGCVREFVDQLPEDFRAVVVLHDLQGLKNREIAEILGCSLDTVKIRLHRARRKLEGALGKGCEFYRDENNVLRCDRKSSLEPDEDE